MNDNNLINNNDIKTEPEDDYFGVIEPENILIKTEIPSPIIYELKLKDEFNNSVILSTDQVIIKEELNIDDDNNDENWEETSEKDPLSIVPEQKFFCEICSKFFSHFRHLNNHLFVIHRPLTVAGTDAFCNKCSKWFPELKYPSHNPCFNYMRSIQNGKKMHSCEICDTDFTAISLLKKHLLDNHRPLIVHENLDLSKAILKQFVCKICGAVFSAEKALGYHLSVMHRPYSITGSGAYCTRCQVWLPEECFKDHRPCSARQQAMVPAFSCNICDAEFKQLQSLKAHLYVIHRPLALLQVCASAFCDKCNRWFKEDNYTMHRCFRRAPIKFANGLEFKCNVCSKECDSETVLKKHLYHVHRPLLAANTNKVLCDFCKEHLNEDKFEAHLPCHSVDSKCVFCLIAMPSREHYLLHDLTWAKWRSYQCNLCNLNTQEMRLADLNKHMIYHGKKSVFRCVKCKFDFTSMENAESHIESFHEGCRCVQEPCVCRTYNYDYYYEFVKQRNVSDFRGNSKYLLENEINKIRDEQYNSIEANIEVWHMRKDSVDVAEGGDIINLNFQIDCSRVQPVEINNILMPSTSTANNKDSIKSEVLTEEIFEESGENRELLVVRKSKNKQFMDVVIKKGADGFGFTLVGEDPCLLDNIVPGSPAAQAGLHCGDAVVQVNGWDVASIPHYLIVDLMKKCTGQLRMKIVHQNGGKTKKKKVPLKVEPFKCNICHLLYERESLLDAHLALKHGPKIDEPVEISIAKEIIEVGEIESKNFECNKCGQEFVEYLKFVHHDPCAVGSMKRCPICHLCGPTLAHFELHKLLYKNSAYVCTICPPLSRVQLKLNAMHEHRKVGHSLLGVYECLRCQTQFASFDQVQAHLMQHLIKDEIQDAQTYKLKEETRLLKCKICKKIMYNEYKLQKHEEQHDQQYLCNVCGKVFTQFLKFKDHAMRHSDERKHACHLCDSKFVMKTNLMRHLKIHEQQKEFQCEQCGQQFTYYTSIICHVASHTSEDLCRCYVCNMKFAKQGQLGVHMETHNKDGTNPNKCYVCNKYFTHKCKLIVHSRIHRPKPKNRVAIKKKTNNRKRRKSSSSSSDDHEEQRKSCRKQQKTNTLVDSEEYQLELEKPKNKQTKKEKPKNKQTKKKGKAKNNI